MLLPRIALLRIAGVWFALAAAASVQAQAPAITTQPAAKTVNAGTAATFTVAASGAGLTYQWMMNGTAISGAASASFTLASPQPTNAGNYSVVVTNSSGSVTSNAVNLLIYTPYIVRTLAGQVGVQGSGNGTGTAASFSHPIGLAADSSGNVYMADTLNCVIRKITAAGVVTTLAGQAGVAGSSDGTGTAAQFNFPSGLCVDGSGNVYVADTQNSTIRKITPAGVVTTLAGTPPTAANPIPMNQGSTNATGTAARFSTPRGIAVDGAGNLYVADTQNSAIRKITPAGVVTTLAGSPGQTPTFTDGTGTSARFDYPFGIASTSAGQLYVADTSSQDIRAITAAGVVTTLAGTGNSAGSVGGTGNIARFNQPTSLAVDGQGNVYVADQNNSTVRKIMPGGVVVTLAGLAGNVGSADGSGTSARFSNPYGIAVDGNGNVYIADTQNATLRVMNTQPAGDVGPQILTQPTSQSVLGGATVTFSVLASATPNPTYQWQKNPGSGAVNIAGATASSLALPNVGVNDAATYDVVVTNEDGSVTSSVVTLTVLTIPNIPAGSQSQTVAAGGTVNLNSNATGGNLTYQWYLNGVSIPGATAASLSLSPAGTYETGTYSVTVTNSLGSLSGTVGTVTVTASARLLNLSAHGPVSPGNVLTAGFGTSGGSKSILVRGVGPALASYGITAPLPTPVLNLYNSSSKVLATDSTGWQASLATVFNQVGAFALPSGSADEALLETLAAGTYSAQVSGAGTSSGVAMAEIYDADTGTPAARLVNLSASANTGTGANVLTGGFVVSGTTSETVLLRGIGPTLANFGVSNVLARPVLTLFNSQPTQLATNSGWGGSPYLALLFNAVGAFSLPLSSADAALVEVLAPGNYTLQVSGLNSTTGNAMVEIYEVPAH